MLNLRHRGYVEFGAGHNTWDAQLIKERLSLKITVKLCGKEWGVAN